MGLLSHCLTTAAVLVFVHVGFHKVGDFVSVHFSALAMADLHMQR